LIEVIIGIIKQLLAGKVNREQDFTMMSAVTGNRPARVEMNQPSSKPTSN
jgi:hypothetical protein